MKAKKENKVYTIDESQKKSYLDKGYDIFDNEGNLLEDSPLKVIAMAEHKAEIEKAVETSKEQIANLIESNDLMAAQIKEKDEMIESLKSGTVPASVLELLKGYAEAKKIDIGSSTSATGILTKITEVEKV